MKLNKKAKILLVCVVIGVLLAITGICVGLEFGNSNIPDSATLVEGSGEYDWVKYNVCIHSSDSVNSGRYSTHCSGDYIENVYFNTKYNSHRIEYDTNFSIFDDLDAMFVISSDDGTRVFSTPVERTHSPVGGDYINIEDDHAFNKAYYIKEIWVRTVD